MKSGFEPPDISICRLSLYVEGTFGIETYWVNSRILIGALRESTNHDIEKGSGTDLLHASDSSAVR